MLKIKDAGGKCRKWSRKKKEGFSRLNVSD
jgi:hypothetical protein